MTDRSRRSRNPAGAVPDGDPGQPFPPLEGEAAEPYLDDPRASADPPQRLDRDRRRARPADRAGAGRILWWPWDGSPSRPEQPPDEEGVAARDRRWTSRTIVVATVFLLIFNAVSIQNWSRQQAPGWVTTTVRRLADVWAEQIAQLGADQPRQAVRDGYEAARDAEWAGTQPRGSRARA